MIRPLVWLRRIRHRRGYGIHSPSAFAFVAGVVYERGEYYAYEPLRRRFCLKGRRLKHARFMLRLANYVQPHTIVMPQGMPEYMQAHLQAGCMTARVVEAALPAHVLLLCGGEQSMIVVDMLDAFGCRKEAGIEGAGLFECLRRHSKAYVTYDLYDFGLVCLDSTKQKQHYIINYESLY